jgi:hypothetical protein
MRIDINERDRRVWREELGEFIPERIFDAHVHLFDRSCLRPGVKLPPKNVLSKFGGVFTKPDLLGWAEAWLPGRALGACHFGFPSLDSDRAASAIYSGSISDGQDFFGLALVAPGDVADAVRERVSANRLVGYKPYVDFVEGKPKSEITIHDMLPPEQMQLADELGLAIMLHIPRPGRLADPVNQKDMVELCRSYPNAHVIFAHIGRAYYLRNVIGFLDGIAGCPNAYVDTAMVNHEGVLEYAFRNFPRERILFGSDAPVACLRGKSVEINNQYAYMMGEDYCIGTVIYDSEKAVEFTSFYYEQLRAIRLAAERAGVTGRELEGIMFGNAARLFSDIAERNYGEAKA